MSTSFQNQIVNFQGVALDYASSTSNNPTLNASSGRFTLPANNATITVTNNRVTALSIVKCDCETDPGALVKRCTPADGSFVMEVNGAGSVSKVFNFTVTNPSTSVFTSISDELTVIDGKLKWAQNVDCPGPFTVIGNSDRTGGTVNAIEVLNSPVVWSVDTNGDIGPTP